MSCHTNKALKSDAERKVDEEEAVYALLLLATGDEEEQERSLKKRKREEDALYETAEKRVRVCKICEKEFESGKALGGQQRYQWRGSYGSSSSTAPDGGEGSGGGRSSDEGKRVVFNFDLNELPPEEDGDQPAEI